MNVQLTLEDVLMYEYKHLQGLWDKVENGTATIKETILAVVSTSIGALTYEQIGDKVREYGKWSHETIGRRVRELARDGEIRTKTVESVIDGENKRYSVFYI